MMIAFRMHTMIFTPFNIHTKTGADKTKELQEAYEWRTRAEEKKWKIETEQKSKQSKR